MSTFKHVCVHTQGQEHIQEVTAALCLLREDNNEEETVRHNREQELENYGKGGDSICRQQCWRPTLASSALRKLLELPHRHQGLGDASSPLTGTL